MPWWQLLQSWAPSCAGNLHLGLVKKKGAGDRVISRASPRPIVKLGLGGMPYIVKDAVTNTRRGSP